MKPSEALKFSRPLWKHQADTMDRFADQDEFAALHEMGTGKTTTLIGWLRWKFVCYNEKFKIKPRIIPLTLIVSPLATLHNWREELIRNSPKSVSDTALVLAGKGKKKLQLLKDTDARIIIINPATLDNEEIVKELRRKNFVSVIVDESHDFKNPRSKRLKSLIYITDFCLYRAISTGTPILQNELDVWAQWRILDAGKTFGLNYYEFRAKYFYDRLGGGGPFQKWEKINERDTRIADLMAFKSSRVSKAECLTLPPLLHMVEHVELGVEQTKAYEQMERELVAEVSSGICTASNALARVTRMLQILTGYLCVEDENQDKLIHILKENPRLARLKQLLEELTPRHKVIVWSVYQENYRIIERVLAALKIEYATLTGQTIDRQGNIDRFQKDERCRVMLANPKAGGVGVNLIQASYAIYFSRSYSLGDRLQSEARNHRGGSEIHTSVTLIDLVAPNTIDEDVLAALQEKQSFSDNVLDRIKSRCYQNEYA